MAASIAAFSQQSRFSVLAIDDDHDSDDNAASKKDQGNSKGAKSANAKKRNRKKKKQEQAEKAELRDMAFGMGRSSTKPPHRPTPSNQANKAASSGPANDKNGEQWDEWRKIDEGFTNEQYEADLQQAILQSQLESEKPRETKSTGGDENGKESKKKKKKKEKATMSLGQFNQFDTVEEALSAPDVQNNANSEVPPPEPDAEFFNRVDKDASKIIMKEKIQEEYTKHYIVQNARTAHYEKELSKKDKEITMLRATVSKLKEETQDAKKRNQQLCHILAQGEMKDKAVVLESLDELTQVKNELMEQITFLTAELEKEKSRNHGLKSELERYQSKSSKHKWNSQYVCFWNHFQIRLNAIPDFEFPCRNQVLDNFVFSNHLHCFKNRTQNFRLICDQCSLNSIIFLLA